MYPPMLPLKVKLDLINSISEISILIVQLFIEMNELRLLLKSVKMLSYIPSDEDLNEFKDGGIAIIEQLICAYSSYFIGTKDSTFSFRIQEEREILGAESTTTFNRFCNKDDSESFNCKSIKWIIQS
jgi:peptide-O-fucosyltransferase